MNETQEQWHRQHAESFSQPADMRSKDPATLIYEQGGQSYSINGPSLNDCIDLAMNGKGAAL